MSAPVRAAAPGVVGAYVAAATEAAATEVAADAGADDLDPLDPLALLERDDKWFLGGAPGLLYAPPTPVWDHVPGFWDEAHFLHFMVQPVFTVTLIDERGAAVPILYGGSVNRSNVDALLAVDEVDGVLVGGASLDAEQWLAIVRSS